MNIFTVIYLKATRVVSSTAATVGGEGASKKDSCSGAYLRGLGIQTATTLWIAAGALGGTEGRLWEASS